LRSDASAELPHAVILRRHCETASAAASAAATPASASRGRSPGGTAIASTPNAACARPGACAGTG